MNRRPWGLLLALMPTHALPPRPPLPPPPLLQQPPSTCANTGQCKYADTFAGLQAALASSTPKILLAAGLYLITETLEISRNVTIEAVDGAAAVLDGQDTRQVLEIRAGFVTLTGLSITNGSDPNCSAPSYYYFLPDILGVHSTCPGGGAIIIRGGTVTFDSCEIYDNEASFTPKNEPAGGGGAYIEGDSQVSLVLFKRVKNL